LHGDQKYSRVIGEIEIASKRLIGRAGCVVRHRPRGEEMFAMSLWSRPDCQPDHFVSRIFLYFPTSIVAELNEICEILGYAPEQLVIKPD